MKKMKKALAVMLAVVLALSCMSILGYSSKEEYVPTIIIPGLFQSETYHYVNGEIECDANGNPVPGPFYVSLGEEEITEIPAEGIVIIATGPLTSDDMADSIAKYTGGNELHFFDAAAPIVDFSTVDMSRAFFASRYGKGNPEDYLNCPMTKEEYDAFYNALITWKIWQEYHTLCTLYFGCI